MGIIINSAGNAVPGFMDIRNALIDLRNNPYEFNLAFSIRIIEEANQNEISLTERQRAIRLIISRADNRMTLLMRREDISEKKQYNLISLFEKTDDDWELVSQDLTILP